MILRPFHRRVRYKANLSMARMKAPAAETCEVEIACAWSREWSFSLANPSMKSSRFSVSFYSILPPYIRPPQILWFFPRSGLEMRKVLLGNNFCSLNPYRTDAFSGFCFPTLILHLLQGTIPVYSEDWVKSSLELIRKVDGRSIDLMHGQGAWRSGEYPLIVERH